MELIGTAFGGVILPESSNSQNTQQNHTSFEPILSNLDSCSSSGGEFFRPLSHKQPVGECLLTVGAGRSYRPGRRIQYKVAEERKCP